MTSFFCIANSFAAPFMSDTSEHYIDAESAVDAMNVLVETYAHPTGLYAAAVYPSHQAYHNGTPPLVRWLCNYEKVKRKATKDLNGFTFMGESSTAFYIDDVRYEVKNPKQGSIVHD